MVPYAILDRRVRRIQAHRHVATPDIEAHAADADLPFIGAMTPPTGWAIAEMTIGARSPQRRQLPATHAGASSTPTVASSCSPKMRNGCRDRPRLAAAILPPRPPSSRRASLDPSRPAGTRTMPATSCRFRAWELGRRVPGQWRRRVAGRGFELVRCAAHAGVTAEIDSFAVIAGARPIPADRNAALDRRQLVERPGETTHPAIPASTPSGFSSDVVSSACRIGALIRSGRDRRRYPLYRRSRSNLASGRDRYRNRLRGT